MPFKIARRYTFEPVLLTLNNLEKKISIGSEDTTEQIAEKQFWIKDIKKYNNYFEGFEESWELIMNETPLNLLRELAIATEKFFKFYSFKNVAPIHVAAEKGSWQLCEFIIIIEIDCCANPIGKRNF